MPELITYKCTFIFQGRKHGWTESYWHQSDVLNYDQAADTARFLAKHRAALLGKPCVLEAIRISRQDESHEGTLIYVNYKGADQEEAAEHDVALLLRMQDSLNSRYKHTFLRGVWDSIESANGEYLKDAAGWPAKIRTFKTALRGEATWGWWGTTAKKQRFLDRYEKDANDRVKFIFSAAMFDNGDIGNKRVIRITGVNGKSVVNGQHVVEVQNLTTCVTTMPMATGAYKFGGYGTMNALGFIRCGSVVDQKITTRKSGAPLLQSAGRAPAKPKI